MRRGLLIVGIIVTVLGVLVLGLGYIVGGAATTQQLAPLPSDLCLTPQGVGSGTLTVSWSGGPSTTKVILTTATAADCSSVSGNTVGTGSGPSGSFTATLTPGTVYALYISGTTTPVSVTYSVSGFTYLMVIGLVVLLVGVVLAVVGLRARPRSIETVPLSYEEAPVAVPAAAPYSVPPPITPATTAAEATAAPVAAAAAPSTQTRLMRDYTPGDPDATGPRYMPASPGQPTAPVSAAAPGGRPPRTCAYCGTVNEAWITNCRKCKRPLSNTGTG